jgi:hypothetical protein
LKKILSILLFFFSVNVSIYSQTRENDTTKNPIIKITHIEIGGRDMPILPTYHLNHYYEIIKFEYTTIPANKNVIYQYRMVESSLGEFREKTWLRTTKTVLKLDSLESKNYNFQLYAIYPNGQKTPIISTELFIENPWWRSWWFWGACFVALFGIFYGRERFLKFWADEERRHTRQISELELRTLQLQMNPHFVFNALNAVQSFILTHDVVAANNYLSKFANLIRLFLDSSRSKYITLSDEIRLLNLYVEMEILRFENKFDYKMVISPDVNRLFEIPTMILQPFVENAINHGLRYKETKGLLTITFINQDKFLICRIEDDGVGRERAKLIQGKSRKGYKSQGLKITEERLQMFNLMSNSDIEFTINDRLPNEKDTGTYIEIKFPKNY